MGNAKSSDKSSKFYTENQEQTNSCSKMSIHSKEFVCEIRHQCEIFIKDLPDFGAKNESEYYSTELKVYVYGLVENARRWLTELSASMHTEVHNDSDLEEMIKGQKRKPNRPPPPKLQNKTNQKLMNSDGEGSAAMSIAEKRMKSDHTAAPEKIASLYKELVKIKKNNKVLQDQMKKLVQEKENLLIRLSKVAADRLVVNNPAIADLNDRYRPTKLAEMYTQLYDDEWTNAYEALIYHGHKDFTAIDTLKDTLEDVVKFCKVKSDRIVDNSTQAVNSLFEEYRNKTKCQSMGKSMTMGNPRNQDKENNHIADIILQNKWKPEKSRRDAKKHEQWLEEYQETQIKPRNVIETTLKKARKDIAESILPSVQKAYLKAKWDKECIPEMKPYIKKCLFIGWMMVVTSPPVCLHKSPKPKDVFDTNVYRAYLSSGKYVKFVVWPALMLHEGGPILTKGVAEGADT